MIASFKPQEAAVEETFVNKDARATLKLGQARGMALLAPAQRGLRMAEYAPNVVKKTVIGAGHGEKRQIQAMIGFLLPRPGSRARTRPTRWPSPSAMPAIARARRPSPPAGEGVRVRVRSCERLRTQGLGVRGT